MHLLFFQHWISDKLLKALCWTLVHSFWQGLLAAAAAGLIILLTRKSTAQLRYNLLGIVFVLFIVASLGTLALQLNDKTTVDTIATTGAGTNVVTVASAETTFVPVASATTVVEKFATWLNSNAGLLFTWWLIIFAFNCLKLLTGIGSVQRLRQYRVKAAPEFWKEKAIKLASTIGINQKIRLLQSALVKVPVTVGMLKPVILVPFGLLAQLPADQVESILLHELAHIRRRDYFVNLLQRFAEAIYFFNPAILWLSALIRQEREACCDDIVMANTPGSTSYVEALVAFQELQLPAHEFAMSIGTKRNYLLNRVKRLLTRENINLNTMEKIFLATGLLALTAFTILPKEHVNEITSGPLPVLATENHKIPTEVSATTFIVAPPMRVVLKKKSPKKIIPVVFQDTSDTTKKKKPVSYDNLTFTGMSTNINVDGKTRTETITATDQSGKKYTVSKLNGEITTLVVDGKTIPLNEVPNHQALLMQIDHGRQAQTEASLKRTELRKAQLVQREALVRTEIARRDMERSRKEQLSMLSRQQTELKRMNKLHTVQQEQTHQKLLRLQERQKAELNRLNDQHLHQLDRTKERQQQDLRRQREMLEKQTEMLKKLNNTTQAQPKASTYPGEAEYTAYKTDQQVFKTTQAYQTSTPFKTTPAFKVQPKALPIKPTPVKQAMKTKTII